MQTNTANILVLSSLLRLLKLVQSISRDLYYPMEDVYD